MSYLYDDLRFKDFTDDELYILKRALIETSKYIYMEDRITYSNEELKLFDNLLAEAIDNINYREHDKELTRVSNMFVNETLEKEGSKTNG